MNGTEAGTDDRLLTTTEVSRRLNLKRNTLAMWRKRRTAGTPPFLKLGSAVRYRASAIDAWLAANEKAPEAWPSTSEGAAGQ